MNKYPEIQLPETKKLFEIPSNFVFKDLIYLLESQSNREGKTKKAHLLVQMAAMSISGPGQSQAPETPPGSPTRVAEAPELGASSVFQGH